MNYQQHLCVLMAAAIYPVIKMGILYEYSAALPIEEYIYPCLIVSEDLRMICSQNVKPCLEGGCVTLVCRQWHVQESDHVMLVYGFRSCKPSYAAGSP